MDERPAFADKAYIKDGPEAATDKSCKKRKEAHIEPRKKNDTIDGSWRRATVLLHQSGPA